MPTHLPRRVSSDPLTLCHVVTVLIVATGMHTHIVERCLLHHASTDTACPHPGYSHYNVSLLMHTLCGVCLSVWGFSCFLPKSRGMHIEAKPLKVPLGVKVRVNYMYCI